jgi:hypothetical protein
MFNVQYEKSYLTFKDEDVYAEGVIWGPDRPSFGDCSGVGRGTLKLEVTWTEPGGPTVSVRSSPLDGNFEVCQ